MALGHRINNLSFRLFRGLFDNGNLETLNTAFGVRHKHYNPKFRWHRKMKVFKPKLDTEMTPQEMKNILMANGIYPQSTRMEAPVYISSSMTIAEPYEPPLGDGKFSLLSGKGAAGLKKKITDTGSNLKATRKIQKYLKDFNMDDFPSLAQDIYISAHKALARKDIDSLQNYATLHAINVMLVNAERKTLRWKFIESIEPPKAVQARAVEIMNETNYFAQVTVRFHTKQMLAVYDRFGRLMYGSEILAKDVLEYVVFENHIANIYGTWKLHGKIIPDWLPPEPDVPVTFREKALDKAQSESS